MFLYGQNAAAQPSMFGALIPFIIIFAIMYLLVIMPARKKQKSHQTMIQALKGGERVVTSGGIYGTVARVLDDRIELAVDKNTKLQVAKSAIAGVLDAAAGTIPEPK